MNRSASIFQIATLFRELSAHPNCTALGLPTATSSAGPAPTASTDGSPISHGVSAVVVAGGSPRETASSAEVQPLVDTSNREVFGAVCTAAKQVDREVGRVFDSLPPNALLLVVSGVGDAPAVRR